MKRYRYDPEGDSMNDRFTGCGLNENEWAIVDKYNNCPLQNIPLPMKTLKPVLEWLNENVKEYHRFELKIKQTSDGRPFYQIWDNELNEITKFRPNLEFSKEIEPQLREYVDWLNSLVEEKEVKND